MSDSEAVDAEAGADPLALVRVAWRRSWRWLLVPVVVLVVLRVVFGPDAQWGDVATWVLAVTSFLALAAAVFAGLVGYEVLRVELRRDVVAADERRRADERARRERLWSDAGVVADVEQLLAEVEPGSRGLSTAVTPAEGELWLGLARRTGEMEARLRVMSMGHSSDVVRVAAGSLPRILWTAYVGSRAHVMTLLTSAENPQSAFDDAKVRYQEAVDALGKLEAAITLAAAAAE